MSNQSILILSILIPLIGGIGISLLHRAPNLREACTLISSIVLALIPYPSKNVCISSNSVLSFAYCGFPFFFLSNLLDVRVLDKVHGKIGSLDFFGAGRRKAG